MSGLLVVVSGPSGVGKGTILKRLFTQRSDCRFSVSATTRSPRPGEVDGESYRFVTIQDFEEAIEQHHFIEWARVFDHYYGTPEESVVQLCQAGYHVILDIDVQGALQVFKKVPDAVSVFIMPPSLQVLEARLRERQTEQEEEILQRLAVARSEMREYPRYDYIVVNDTVKQAAGQLSSILDVEVLKSKRVANSDALKAMLAENGNDLA